MDILLIFPEVFGKGLDILGEHGHLDFSGTGIVAVDLVFLDDPRFCFSV